MERVLPLPIQESTQSLIDHLVAAEVWIRYQNACTQFNEDNEAQALQNRITELQVRLRQKQAKDETMNPVEVDTLRLFQQRAQRDPVLMAYTQSQQEAIHFLREINDEISQYLGINFAAFANHSTC